MLSTLQKLGPGARLGARLLSVSPKEAKEALEHVEQGDRLDRNRVSGKQDI